MIIVLFDSNIYNKLSIDETFCLTILDLVAEGKIKVIAPQIIIDELANSPFGGIPEFFPVTEIPDGVAIPGLARPGTVIPGDGKTFSEHLGTSKKAKDAVIADTVANHANVFVSDDNRCRDRLNRISSATKCYGYEEFKRCIYVLVA